MLYHCVQAGLDLAIVNSEKLHRYPSIPEEERKLAEDLIWWRGDDPIAAFAAYFRERKSTVTAEDRKSMPLDDRLARYILEGSKDGLVDDLNEALTTRGPLEIINGPLMKGMDEVGRLFNANQMIVAEVLQSAEAMKAAVAHLEPHMEKSESATKGKIILATVKGDVHDIGKNLVEIILSNNGYRVVNLGIKVPPEELIKAFREHGPDAIGLSGLLVKSAQMMVATAQDLKTAGIDCPILVGGAALSNRFTRMKIAPEYPGLVAYANDAMNGLDLANQIMDFERRESLKHVLAEQSKKMLESAPKVVDAPADATPRTSSVRRDVEIPKPPDLKTHVIRNYDLGEIFEYINPKTLYSKHLGFQNYVEAFEAGDPKARDLHDRVEEVAQQILARSDISANAVYRFFPAQSDRSHRHDLFARRQDSTRVVHLRPPERRAVSMPRRLRRGARLRPHRLSMHVRRDHRHRRSRARRRLEKQGRLSPLAHPASARDRRRRGVRRTAAPEDSTDVGNRRSAGTLAQGSRAGALPRQAFLVRLSCLPATRRSGTAVPPARSREECDRRSADRRLHDGSRERRQRRRLPSSRGEVFSLSPADIERLEREFEAAAVKRAAS